MERGRRRPSSSRWISGEKKGSRAGSVTPRALVENGVLVYHGRVVLDPKVYSLLLCSFSHKVIKVDGFITLVLERNRLIAMPRLARLVYCAGLNGFRRRNLFVAVSRQSRLLK